MDLLKALPNGVRSNTIENALFEVFVALHAAEISSDVKKAHPDYVPATSFTVSETDGVIYYSLRASLPLSQIMAAYGAVSESVTEFIPVLPPQAAP